MNPEPWTPPNRQRYFVADNPDQVDWAIIPQRSTSGLYGNTEYIACSDDEAQTFAVVHDANHRTGLFRNWVVVHDAPSSDEAGDWAIAQGYDRENWQFPATVVSMPR